MFDFHKHARKAFGSPSFFTWDDSQFGSDQLAFSAAQKITQIIGKFQTFSSSSGQFTRENWGF